MNDEGDRDREMILLRRRQLIALAAGLGGVGVIGAGATVVYRALDRPHGHAMVCLSVVMPVLDAGVDAPIEDAATDAPIDAAGAMACLSVHIHRDDE